MFYLGDAIPGQRVSEERGSKKTRQFCPRVLQKPQKDGMPAPMALQNITVLGDETVPQVSAWEGKDKRISFLGPLLSSFPVIKVHTTFFLSMLGHITCSHLASYSAAFNLGWGGQRLRNLHQNQLSPIALCVRGAGWEGQQLLVAGLCGLQAEHVPGRTK